MKTTKISCTRFDILPVTADSLTRRFSGNADKLHCHNHAELWYVLKGKMKNIINGREYIQTPGTFALVRAYNAHNIDTTLSDETPVIFSASANESVLEELGFDCFLRHSSVACIDGRLLPEFTELSGKKKAEADILARRLLEESSKMHPDSPKKRILLFAEFLRIFADNMPAFRITKSFKEKTRLMNEAADYIVSHYNENIPLDSLAEKAHMSKRRFTDNFRSVTGMTTGELLRLKRMYHADQLLCFSEKTLEDIASKIGFYDKSSFSHTFKSHFGITPAEYRRKNTEESYKFESKDRLKRKRRWEVLNYYYSLANGGKELPKSSVSAMPNLI